MEGVRVEEPPQGTSKKPRLLHSTLLLQTRVARVPHLPSATVRCEPVTRGKEA